MTAQSSSTKKDQGSQAFDPATSSTGWTYPPIHRTITSPILDDKRRLRDFRRIFVHGAGAFRLFTLRLDIAPVSSSAPVVQLFLLAFQNGHRDIHDDFIQHRFDGHSPEPAFG